MRALVSGASGFLGLAAVRAIAAAGHDVVGLVRSQRKTSDVEGAGGRAVVGNVLNATAVRKAVKGADAVLHLAAGDGAEFARVRIEGCRNLVTAAKAAGVTRFVVGSGYWLFGHRNGTITEETPPKEGTAGQANLETERVALAAHHPDEFPVAIARPGMVYGNGGWFAPMVREIRDGSYGFVGNGSNKWSPVHLADVGEAFRVVLERGAPGNVYLVVDDETVPVRTFASFVAERLGAPEPTGIPRLLAAMKTGRALSRARAANQAASNAKLKGLGWRPRFPTYRDGVPDVLREMGLFSP